MRKFNKIFSVALLFVTLAMPVTVTASLTTIHAGHGGVDPGALGSGYTEADLARRITANMVAKTGAFDATDNTATSVNDNLNKIVRNVRLKSSSGSDWNISNHLNAASPSATGVEVFYFSGDPEGKAKAEQISATISQALDIPNRGAKIGDGLFVINSTPGHSLLIEWAFITNPGDVQKLLGNLDVAVNRVINLFGYGATIVDPNQPTTETGVQLPNYWVFWNVGHDFKRVQEYRVNMNKIMKIDYSDIYYNQNVDGTWSIGITNLDLNGLQNYRLQLMQRYGLAGNQMNGQEFFVDSYVIGYKDISLSQVQNLRLRWLNEGYVNDRLVMQQNANGKWSLFTNENSFRQVQHRRIMLDRLNPDMKISEQRHYELEK